MTSNLRLCFDRNQVISVKIEGYKARLILDKEKIKNWA